jgi:hypothetical protein
VTIDGPSPQIVESGNVAMASDGTGGAVYLKLVEGIPHVFASRYVGGQWTPPARVDWDQPYAASQPRISAGPGGSLLVVWVTGVATVKGKVQYGLFSSRIGANATSFGRSLPIDPNIGNGLGVEPTLAGATPSKAIVAYRAITFEFTPNASTAGKVQLRPGDVIAEIRVARLNGERWSRLGAMNRNVEASTRAPSLTNGPQIGEGLEGNAVVAWQEPDQTGTARIWVRKIFGSNTGPPLQASPSSWEGKPVSADADAFSLSVTDYLGAQVAMRIAPTAGSALAGRVLLNTLPPNYATSSVELTGPVLADGGATAAGPPDIAAAESSQPREISLRLDFGVGSAIRQLKLGSDGKPTEMALPPGPPALPGSEPVVTVDPEGGGVLAYPAAGPGGTAVAIRQEFASGAAQTGLVAGTEGGPIGQLTVGRSGSGDGLVGFRQGEPGNFEIVVDRVSTPPSSFKVEPPKKWLKPNAVELRWGAPRTTVGGLRYSVLVDGQAIGTNLSKRTYRPKPAQLGNGTIPVSILATDALGQQQLTEPAKLRVDGLPPEVKATVGKKGLLRVLVTDPDSGVRPASTSVRFGDGEGDRRAAKFKHTYESPGRYTVVVRASDKVGNRVVRRFRVNVG